MNQISVIHIMLLIRTKIYASLNLWVGLTNVFRAFIKETKNSKLTLKLTIF